jgi:uncharacterized protein (UPF0332 family)
VQRPIKPEWLIRQANKLAGRDPPATGQPINADLRRAVSAAYYALFHKLIICAGEALLPKGTQEDRWRFGRHFEHAAMKRVCGWATGQSSAPARYRPLLSPLSGDPQLMVIALAFQALQQDRHSADYDHEANFTKPQVLNLIDLASTAIVTLDALKGTAPLQVFLVQMAISSKGP